MATSSATGRLDARPTHIIDRSKIVEFQFNGRRVEAYEGDTVSSALYASGVRIHSRSFKYHRPRGLLCVAGRCPNCLMTVDGVPNVRACVEPVREGMAVRHQNAWPSLDHDMFAVMDKMDRLLPVGFYYKTFHTPKFFWDLSRPIIRRVAGLGSVPEVPSEETRQHHDHRHADVAVIGGGAAGMSAAITAAGTGARVILVDDQPSLGGYLRTDPQPYSGLPDMPQMAGHQVARRLAEEIVASENLDWLSNASAFGYYEGNLLGVDSGEGVIKVRAKQIVFATGSFEVPLPFDRNDLPGVMLSTGAQRLVNLYGVSPGSTAMVITAGDHGYYAALDLLNAGLRIAVVADSRPEFPHGLDAADELRSRGVLVLASHVLIRGEGVRKVVGGTVARLVDGKPTTEERQFDADVIAMSGGFQPANALVYQAGCTLVQDESRDIEVPGKMPPSIHVAGEVAGVTDLTTSILQGWMAGAEAAASLGFKPAVNPSVLRERMERAQSAERSQSPAPPLVVPEQGVKKFVCVCEDVTVKDIEQAIDEGFEDIQTLKRYTTATMGPCQGKMCHRALARITAQQTGRSLGETGVTTSRPPVKPVSLGALAGPGHIPVKRTPLDGKHRSLGAKVIDSGGWRRPHSYGSPQEESLLVRQGVGIIDVSTLGKLDVQGSDAPALLDKVYTHHFSDLRPGRIRYGMLCADNGTIMDDGTVTRISEDHYFVTTSTANVEIIEEWFKWWLAGTGQCAHVTNVTGALAAINVAGPRARETLSKLTDVDLEPKAFRYMRSKRGDAAGVPTIFLRIGFVGETGWELHFPAEYADYMWDALMDAGEEYDIGPFGVEAQRILRLEKRHIIPSQDTDMLSTPLDSASEWVVRFDKEDFIGRGGLAAAQERGAKNVLVGFVMQNGAVPDDGDPVVAGSTPVGRVTSSRLSPTLGKGFGFAVVPAEMAEEGKKVEIRVGRETYAANVTLQPFYDPEGKRLRA